MLFFIECNHRIKDLINFTKGNIFFMIDQQNLHSGSFFLDQVWMAYAGALHNAKVWLSVFFMHP